MLRVCFNFHFRWSLVKITVSTDYLWICSCSFKQYQLVILLNVWSFVMFWTGSYNVQGQVEVLLSSLLSLSSPVFSPLISFVLLSFFSSLLLFSPLFFSLILSSPLFYSILFPSILLYFPLFSSILLSSLFFSSLLFYSLLFSPPLFSSVILSFPLFSYLILTSPLFYLILTSPLFYSRLFYSLIFYSILFSYLFLCSSLSCSPLLSSLLFFSIFFSFLFFLSSTGRFSWKNFFSYRNNNTSYNRFRVILGKLCNVSRYHINFACNNFLRIPLHLITLQLHQPILIDVTRTEQVRFLQEHLLRALLMAFRISSRP